MRRGYYVRANRDADKLSPSYHSTISLPGTLGRIRLEFRLSEPEKFEYLRFFPYIHEGDFETLRLWDVERGVDAPLKMYKDSGSWYPYYVKKRFPRLFEHGKRLGYWKDV